MLKINIIKNSNNSYYIQELVFGLHDNIYINGQKIKPIQICPHCNGEGYLN